MEDLIATLFLSREITHRAHLATDSYAEHVALGSFYEDIIPLADSLAEAYQGRTGKRLTKIPYLAGSPSVDALVSLKKILKQIETTRTTCCPDDSTIQNLIDEVISLYLSTIYKLTFLK